MLVAPAAPTSAGASAPGEPPSPPPGSRRRRRPLVGGLAALAVLGATASAYLAVAGPGAHRPVDRLAAAREAAVGTARQEVTNLTTYDYRTVRADFDRVAGLATGRFASDFRSGSGDLQRLILAGKASAKGTVISAGAETYGARHALVLLAVDDAVRNAKIPGGTVRRYRFEVTVDLVGDRWLVSDLHPVA